MSATTTPAPTTQESTTSQATTRPNNNTLNRINHNYTEVREANSYDAFDSDNNTIIKKFLILFINDFDEDDTPITETDFGTFYNTDAGKELIDSTVSAGRDEIIHR